MTRARQRRMLGAVLVVTAFLLLGVAPAHAQLPDPCALLRRSEVSQLLGKRVVKASHRRDQAHRAARCTWVTRYYQTREFKRLHAAFSLKLDTQALSAAADNLAELRTSAADPEEKAIERVSGLGDEAFRRFNQLIVVSGDAVLVVGVGNFDTSKKPHPPVDDIARRAMDLALPRLATAPSL